MLSIIIPSYKDGRIIRAIRSIRRFDDTGKVQIVVIDGGSEDDLLSRIRTELHAEDILISERDRGIFDALNKGLRCAGGNLIGWIGSDDVFHDQVKASDIERHLAGADVVVGGTAMVDRNKVKRVFWLSSQPEKAVFAGLHNPHFSTFGRAEVFRRAQFDIESPVADIKYFLDVFSAGPITNVDRRIVMLQQVGGYSNGSWRKTLRNAVLIHRLYMERRSFLGALSASGLRLIPKFGSAFYYRLFHTTINDTLLSEE